MHYVFLHGFDRQYASFLNILWNICLKWTKVYLYRSGSKVYYLSHICNHGRPYGDDGQTANCMHAMHKFNISVYSLVIFIWPSFRIVAVQLTFMMYNTTPMTSLFHLDVGISLHQELGFMNWQRLELNIYTCASSWRKVLWDCFHFSPQHKPVQISLWLPMTSGLLLNCCIQHHKMLQG